MGTVYCETWVCVLCTVYCVVSSQVSVYCLVCSVYCVPCSWCILCNECFFDILCVLCTVYCVVCTFLVCTVYPLHMRHQLKILKKLTLLSWSFQFKMCGTVYCVPCTVYCVVWTSFSVQRVPECVLFRLCILCNGCFFYILCVLCSVQSVPFQCILYTLSVTCVTPRKYQYSKK